MTRDELAAALREKGWETVSVETFREWFGGDPVLLDAHREDPDRTLRVKVCKGPAQAMCAITDRMLAASDREAVVGVLHDRLRYAWADAVWKGA